MRFGDRIEVQLFPAGRFFGFAVNVSVAHEETYDAAPFGAAWHAFWTMAKELDISYKSVPMALLFRGKEGQSMRYIAGGCIQSELPDLPEGFETFDFEGGAYVVHIHEGSMVNIGDSVKTFYTELLPQSEHKLRDGPHLELYHHDGDPESDDYKMGLAAPIVF